MKQPRTKIAQTIADQHLKGGSTKAVSKQVAAYLLAERRVNDLEFDIARCATGLGR